MLAFNTNQSINVRNYRLDVSLSSKTKQTRKKSIVNKKLQLICIVN